MNETIASGDVDVGDELPPVRLTFSSLDVRRYAEASDMPGGRFMSDEAAREEGLPGQIIPGNMSLALFSRVLTSWRSGLSVRRLSATFRRIIHPNTQLVVRAIVTERHLSESGTLLECDLLLENGEGDRLVTGTATVRLP